jgi:uncharacterized protein YcbX
MCYHGYSVFHVFQTAFVDLCPYLVIAESSVETLNDRLENPVTFLNFRPNILLEGTVSFDEVGYFQQVIV